MDVFRRLVPSAIRRRYAVKFGIVLLVLGLGVGLVGFVATAGITDQVEDRVQDDHTSFADQEAQNLQMWNEQNEHTIGVIAWSDVVASDESDAIEERFLDWEEHLDADTHAISYVDTDDDDVLASTDLDAETASADDIEGVPEEAYDIAHGEADESHPEEVPWVSDTYTVDRDLGDEEVAVMTYVQSVPNEDDRAIVYTAEVEAHANTLDDDSGVTTTVLDGNDELMMDNADYGDDHETLGEEYGGDVGAIVDPARTEGAGTHEVDGSELNFNNNAYEIEDDDYVVSSARVMGTDWVVATHEPESEAYGFVNTVNDWGYIATLAGVLMIGLIGAVLGRNTAVSIDRLTGKAGKMEDGNLDVDLETKRVDNIGRLYNGFDSMRVALREQIEEAESAREEAEQERKRVERINDQLERKADEYSDVMEAAADGDLTARMDAESDNEAMEEIGSEFNQMLEEIEGTVAGLNRFATDVATASEQVTASSEEVRSASQQVTESIQEISDGAERQNQSLQSVNQEMSALSTTTEEIAASSNEVADIAERTVTTGQGGQEAAQEAITAMDEIETEAGAAVDEIRRLEQEVQQIDELIATISEIARQTNMLALNANIEASRSASGSDDEGFSVVAKEVKALSEDVAEAADEAEDRLEAIRERTEQSADEVEGTSTNIESAGEQVEEAVEALEQITSLAQETNVGVQEISAATEEQAASTQEVVAMVDGAATVSEETTSEAENVAAAAEEQTTALTEVTESASNLSGQAAELSEALDRFETDTERSDLEDAFDDSDDDDSEPPAFDAEDDDDGQPPSDDSRGGQSITFDSSETATGETNDAVPAEDSQSATGAVSEPGQATESADHAPPEVSEPPIETPEPEPEPASDAPTRDTNTSGDATTRDLDTSDIGAGDEATANATPVEPASSPDTLEGESVEPDTQDERAPTSEMQDGSVADVEASTGDGSELAAEDILGLDDRAESGSTGDTAVDETGTSTEAPAATPLESEVDDEGDDTPEAVPFAAGEPEDDDDEQTSGATATDADAIDFSGDDEAAGDNNEAAAENADEDGEDAEDDVFTFGEPDEK